MSAVNDELNGLLEGKPARKSSNAGKLLIGITGTAIFHATNIFLLQICF
jgi:hypothetical protein